MSNWYAAHLILYVKLRAEPQGRVPVWENIVLVKAASLEEAFAKAEQRGKEEAEDDDPSFLWGGKPAQWVFAGIRKVTSCEDPDRRPGDGTEVTFTEMLVESEQAVSKLVNGESVAVEFTERFADELAKSLN